MLNKTKRYNIKYPGVSRLQIKKRGSKMSKRRSKSKKTKSKRKSKSKKRSKKRRRNYLDGVFNDDKFNEELKKIITYVTKEAGDKDAMIKLADFLTKDDDFTLKHKIKIFDEMKKIIKIPEVNNFLNQKINSMNSNNIILKASTAILDKNKINEKLKFIIIYVKNNGHNYDAMIKLTSSITTDDDFTLEQKIKIFNEMKKIIKLPGFDTFLNDLTTTIGAPPIPIPVTRTSVPPIPIPVTRTSAPPIPFPVTLTSAPPFPVTRTRTSAPPFYYINQHRYEDTIRGFFYDKDIESMKIYINKENNLHAEYYAKKIINHICGSDYDYDDDKITELTEILYILINSGKIGEKTIHHIISSAICSVENDIERLNLKHPNERFRVVPTDEEKIKIIKRNYYIMQILLRSDLSKYLNDDFIKKYTDFEDEYTYVYGGKLNISLKSLSGLQKHSKL
jgi:hypothetical protein